MAKGFIGGPGELERLLQDLIQPPQTKSQGAGTIASSTTERLQQLTDTATPNLQPATTYNYASYGETTYRLHDDMLCLGMAGSPWIG